jgi:MYXO-CTERM domain-containing protein
MRSWSSLVLAIALLSPLGTARANDNNNSNGGDCHGVLLGIDTGAALDLNGTVALNGVLSALTHTDVDLSLDAHVALATSAVELDDLIAQIMVEVGTDDLDALLHGTVTVGDVLDALIVVAAEDGNLTAVAALQALMLDMHDLLGDGIELGDLFMISDLRLVDGMHVDLLDVVVNMASLWDQHHVIEPTTITIDGDDLELDASILSATLDINVQNPPQIIVGPEEVSAEVGNIEVLAHVDLADIEANLDATGLPLLGAKIVVGEIDLCLYAPWISARADVLDNENGAVMVDADVSRIHMCIGTPVQGAIGEGSDDLDLETEVMPSLIGHIVVWIAGHEVPIARVKARSVASVEASAEAMLFEGDFPASFPYDLGASQAELFEQLFANLEIRIELLGITLSPIQLQALQTLALDATLGAIGLPDILSGELFHRALLPTVEILGSGIGAIDLDLGGLACDLLGGDQDGNGNDHDGDLDVDLDVDVDADVDVSVDESTDVGVDTDIDVGVDVDADGDSIDANVDADVDADIDVDVDEHGVDADVDVDADGEVDLSGSMVGAGAAADGSLNLAGGGCSVRGASSSTTNGFAPLALLGLTLLLRARRKSARS